MELPQLSFTQNSQYPQIYDLSLQKTTELENYTEVEVEFLFYPLSRKVTAKDYQLYPFEEYTNELVTKHRSLYSKISFAAAKIFGLSIGLIILLVFLVFNPRDLFSVESVVSIIGAYAIGKELWGDIEEWLEDTTEKWRLSYAEASYFYKLNSVSSLLNYSALAKKLRYQKQALSPEKLDFINQSNSKMARLLYHQGVIKELPAEQLHLLSLHFQPEQFPQLETNNYVAAVKISLNKSWWVFSKTHEYYQALNKGKLGAYLAGNNWQEKALVYKETICLGRLRLLLLEKSIANSSIFAKLHR